MARPGNPGVTGGRRATMSEPVVVPGRTAVAAVRAQDQGPARGIRLPYSREPGMNFNGVQCPASPRVISYALDPEGVATKFRLTFPATAFACKITFSHNAADNRWSCCHCGTIARVDSNMAMRFCNSNVSLLVVVCSTS
jgi:hypothetical protein